MRKVFSADPPLSKRVMMCSNLILAHARVMQCLKGDQIPDRQDEKVFSAKGLKGQENQQTSPGAKQALFRLQDNRVSATGWFLIFSISREVSGEMVSENKMFCLSKCLIVSTRD